ncbi:hypothetical protein D5a_00042 [Faustovirus]|nr:hypothetical protein D5a_00042 [Faustovirus]QBR98952.1 hypothetical protein [Faustovirus mariensis]
MSAKMNVNVFEQACRNARVNHRRENLIFENINENDIPKFNPSIRECNEIRFIIVNPFENCILGVASGGNFAPITEVAPAEFNFQTHGNGLNNILKDDIVLIIGVIARLFVRLSNNTLTFDKCYNEIAKLDKENSPLVIDSTLAQRDNIVYYLTRCSMDLYEYLEVILGESNYKGIDATVASQLLWMDRAIMFKDLRSSKNKDNNEHYLWFNSAFKWFASKYVSRFRGGFPVNDHMYDLHRNMQKQYSGDPSNIQKYIIGEERYQYLEYQAKVIAVFLQAIPNYYANALKRHAGKSPKEQTKCILDDATNAGMLLVCSYNMQVDDDQKIKLSSKFGHRAFNKVIKYDYE